jgi:large subunit ribosomal protein L24
LKEKDSEQVMVVVEGVNVVKKNNRTREKGKKGQIIELPAPIHISKVMLIDPKSGQPTRVGYKIEGTEKKRVAKRSGELI